jgi:hypothetical protein
MSHSASRKRVSSLAALLYWASLLRPRIYIIWYHIQYDLSSNCNHLLRRRFFFIKPEGRSSVRRWFVWFPNVFAVEIILAAIALPNVFSSADRAAPFSSVNLATLLENKSSIAIQYANSPCCCASCRGALARIAAREICMLFLVRIAHPK